MTEEDSKAVRPSPDRVSIQRAYQPRDSAWVRFWAIFHDILLGASWWIQYGPKSPEAAPQRMSFRGAVLLGFCVLFGFMLAFSRSGLDSTIAMIMSVSLLGTLCLVGSTVTTKAERRAARSRAGMCRVCEYALDGLPSVGVVELNGVEYDIGPVMCPECGHAWPRILPA